MGVRELIETILILATVIQGYAIWIHYKIARQTGWIRAMTIYCCVYASMLVPRIAAQFSLYSYSTQKEWPQFVSVAIFLVDSIGLSVAGRMFLQLLQRQMERMEVATERELATDAAQDVIIHMDQKGTITYVNDAVTRMLGFRKDQLEGQSIQTIMPMRYREPHRKGLAAYIATGKKSLDWSAVKVSALTTWGHGAEVPVEISFGEFFVRGERRFVGVMRRIDNHI